MSRAPLPPPHDPTALRVHELVRDWPETLAALRRAGVDVARRGAEPIADVAPPGSAARAALDAAVGWRQ